MHPDGCKMKNDFGQCELCKENMNFDGFCRNDRCLNSLDRGETYRKAVILTKENEALRKRLKEAEAFGKRADEAYQNSKNKIQALQVENEQLGFALQAERKKPVEE